MGASNPHAELLSIAIPTVYSVAATRSVSDVGFSRLRQDDVFSGRCPLPDTMFRLRTFPTHQLSDQCGSTLRSTVDISFETVEELLAASSGVCCQTWYVVEGSRDLSLL